MPFCIAFLSGNCVEYYLSRIIETIDDYSSFDRLSVCDVRFGRVEGVCMCVHASKLKKGGWLGPRPPPPTGRHRDDLQQQRASPPPPPKKKTHNTNWQAVPRCAKTSLVEVAPELWPDYVPRMMTMLCATYGRRKRM